MNMKKLIILFMICAISAITSAMEKKQSQLPTIRPVKTGLHVSPPVAYALWVNSMVKQQEMQQKQVEQPKKTAKEEKKA